MAEATVVDKIVDRSTKGDENVQIGKSSQNSTPKQGFPANLGTENSFTQGSAKGYLCHRIQLLSSRLQCKTRFAPWFVLSNATQLNGVDRLVWWQPAWLAICFRWHFRNRNGTSPESPFSFPATSSGGRIKPRVKRRVFTLWPPCLPAQIGKGPSLVFRRLAPIDMNG